MEPPPVTASGLNEAGYNDNSRQKSALPHESALLKVDLNR